MTANGSTAERLGLVRTVPIFAGLDPIELAAIEGLLTQREVTKGEVLFEQGDESDGLYLLMDGELEVVAEPSGEILRRLTAPDLVGEMGLVLGERRTAGVVAARASSLLVLAAEDFHRLAAREPSIMANVCTVLANRLSTSFGQGATARPCTIVGVRATRGSERLGTLVAGALQALVPGAALVPPGDDFAAQMADVDRLRAEHRWIILPVADGEPASRVDEVCDTVITVTDSLDGGSSASPADRVSRIVVLDATASVRSPIPINSCEPFVVVGEEAVPDDPEGMATFLRVRANHPFAIVMARLARRLQGEVIGVALGGGAALGIAHIGVLQVLEREGIPVDVLAGTSMGSIVAVGYATGISAADMADIARTMGSDWRKLVSLVDLNPLHSGLLSGDRMQSLLRPFLRDTTDFDQLVLPCRTVACDINTGERVEYCDGRLIDAARASSSIPIIISPAREADRVLVDGAIVDPVPAEVVRSMGANRVIAVNVVPHLDPGTQNALTRASRLLSKANPLQLVHRRASTNVLDVALNTIQSLQHELGHYKAASADVRLNPRLAEFTWLDFWHADRIIERGVEVTEEALPELRKLLSPIG